MRCRPAAGWVRVRLAARCSGNFRCAAMAAGPRAPAGPRCGARGSAGAALPVPFPLAPGGIVRDREVSSSRDEPALRHPQTDPVRVPLRGCPR